MFTDETGIDVRVVAVGTGQAIRNAANGDGDILFVHSRSAEEAFMADGNGASRHPVMYNDFVIVGPAADPVGLSGERDAVAALMRIAGAAAVFVSRGDESGTHKAERRLWAETATHPDDESGNWYREAGAGMGATLNIAVGMDAYTLTDRATWIAFGNKARHRILVEGDERLFNQYSVIIVSPDKHPKVKIGPAQEFVDWITSDTGQSAIADFRVNGQQLFYPNAN